LYGAPQHRLSRDAFAEAGGTYRNGPYATSLQRAAVQELHRGSWLAIGMGQKIYITAKMTAVLMWHNELFSFRLAGAGCDFCRICIARQYRCT
jgi:hypothetical protein